MCIQYEYGIPYARKVCDCMDEDLYLQPLDSDPAYQVRGRVYEQLRQAILKGSLKPGSRLVERKLAEQLGVSRTPVREAVRMLELEGLVSHLPRIGAAVARVNQQEVLEIYRIRAVLEGLAARMAAEKISPVQLQHLNDLLKQIEESAGRGDMGRLEGLHREFNDVIYKAAGSPRLYGMITTLADYIAGYARVGYTYPGRMAEATKEHRQLVESIRLRDGDLAERTAREHIENSRRAYFNEIASKLEHVPVGEEPQGN